MSVRIDTFYRARCYECGWTNELGGKDILQMSADEHERQHNRWQLVGRELEGMVFDPNAPEYARFGHIDLAVRAARGAGFAFLSWNGYVYPVNDPCGRKVCMTSDVPGLTQ